MPSTINCLSLVLRASASAGVSSRGASLRFFASAAALPRWADSRAAICCAAVGAAGMAPRRFAVDGTPTDCVLLRFYGNEAAMLELDVRSIAARLECNREARPIRRVNRR